MRSARTATNPSPPPCPIFLMSHSSCSGADHARAGRPRARSPLELGTMCWLPVCVVAVIPINKVTVLSPAPSLPAPQQAGQALEHGRDTSSHAGTGEEAHPADPGAAAAHRQPEGDCPGAEEHPAGECHCHAVPGIGAVPLPVDAKAITAAYAQGLGLGVRGFTAADGQGAQKGQGAVPGAALEQKVHQAFWNHTRGLGCILQKTSGWTRQTGRILDAKSRWEGRAGSPTAPGRVGRLEHGSAEASCRAAAAG